MLLQDNDRQGNAAPPRSAMTKRWNAGSERMPLVAIVLAVLLLTLTPFAGLERAPFSYCVGCEHRYLADGILNLALFVPLGFLATSAAENRWKGFAAGVALSVFIEIVQTLVPGRDPGLTDIIFNSAGAAVGALVSGRVSRWFATTPGWWSGGASLAGIVAILAGTAWLLQPAGQKLAANSFVLPSRNVPPGILVTLQASTDSLGREWYVGRIDDDLVLRYTSRAAEAGLDEPEYRVRGTFAARGERAGNGAVTVTPERNHWCVRSADDYWCRLGPTVGRGWAMLVWPDAIGRRWADWVDALWTVFLFALLGVACSRRTAPMVIVIAGLAAALIPVVFGIVAMSLLEWAGAGAGVLAGMMIRRVTRAGEKLSPDWSAS